MSARRDVQAALLGGLAVFSVALAVRVIGLDQDAGGDELYHILAAKQLLADGTMRIHGAAPYDRAAGFTRLIAWLFEIFGESVVVARVPSVIAGSLTASLVFLWVRAVGEGPAAWIAGLLVALDPELVKLSQWARFYTAHHLLFLVGVVATYAALSGSRRWVRRGVLCVVAAAAFRTALHLQVNTKVGVAGVVSFATLVLGFFLFRAARRSGRGWILGAGAVLVAAVGVFLAIRLGAVAEAGRLATDVDLWSADRAREWRFYHSLLRDAYPSLWPVFPVLLIVSATIQPRLTLACACVFGVSFVSHSLIAMKHVRYLSYALPYFFVPCSVAIARGAPALARLASQLDLPWPASDRARRRAGFCLAGLALAFVLLANPALPRTARLLLMDPGLRQPGMEHEGLSWRRAAQALRPIARSSEVVVSADDLSTLYYIGALDYVISRTQLGLEGTDREFTRDSSTATPIVTEPASIRAIMECHRSGLIVARSWSLRTAWAVPPETAEYIVAHADRIPLPPAWGIEAFVWRTPAQVGPVDCPPESRVSPLRDAP